LNKAVAAINNCIENPALMKEIKQQGMEYVKSMYDWNRLIYQFIESEKALFAENPL
jgi:glycosyltransferase involved in cell wall biosynthesis